MKKSVLLIDGNSLLRSYTYDWKNEFGHTNNFLSTLANIVAVTYPKEKPIIAVLWDGASWRKNYNETYKANREISKDKEVNKEVEKRRLKKLAEMQVIYQNADLLRKILKSLNVTQVYASNYEADDLAAFYTLEQAEINLACHKGHGESPNYEDFREVCMLSGDKDWLQLINNGIYWKDVRSPHKTVKLSDFKIHTGFENPKVFLESKYLLGDTGDNVKGLEGFGEVKVKKFFNLYGDIETFTKMPYETVSNMWGKSKPKSFDDLHKRGFEACKEQEALMNLGSAAVPQPVGFTKAIGQTNLDKLQDIFRQYGFMDLYLGFNEYKFKMGI